MNFLKNLFVESDIRNKPLINANSELIYGDLNGNLKLSGISKDGIPSFSDHIFTTAGEFDILENDHTLTGGIVWTPIISIHYPIGNSRFHIRLWLRANFSQPGVDEIGAAVRMDIQGGKGTVYYDINSAVGVNFSNTINNTAVYKVAVTNQELFAIGDPLNSILRVPNWNGLANGYWGLFEIYGTVINATTAGTVVFQQSGHIPNMQPVDARPIEIAVGSFTQVRKF